MKSRSRLRRRSDFEHAFRGRRLHPGRLLVAVVAPPRDARLPGWDAALGNLRIGVTTSRQVRGAVLRNRLRRRLREAARVALLPLDSILRMRGIAFDVVLIGRPSALDAPQVDLVAEVERVAAGLERMARSGSDSPSAAQAPTSDGRQ